MSIADHAAVTLDALASEMSGELVRPEDEIYDEARSVWNGMIDLRPAGVARCASTADVRAAIAAARSAGLPLAVRGGGHNVAGFGTIDGGLVIDLSPMRGVSVDASTRRVRVGGGATLDDLDSGTQAHGLVVPSGVVTETGDCGIAVVRRSRYLLLRVAVTGPFHILRGRERTESQAAEDRRTVGGG